jgi:hypothetical protein
MPYIKPERREALEKYSGGPATVGELNYAITKLCDAYLKEIGLNYTNLNAVIGVLECAKLEFYRRIAAPYEDIKLAENTDVYTVNK